MNIDIQEIIPLITIILSKMNGRQSLIVLLAIIATTGFILYKREKRKDDIIMKLIDKK